MKKRIGADFNNLYAFDKFVQIEIVDRNWTVECVVMNILLHNLVYLGKSGFGQT